MCYRSLMLHSPTFRNEASQSLTASTPYLLYAKESVKPIVGKVARPDNHQMKLAAAARFCPTLAWGPVGRFMRPASSKPHGDEEHRARTGEDSLSSVSQARCRQTFSTWLLGFPSSRLVTHAKATVMTHRRSVHPRLNCCYHGIGSGDTEAR
ncbi:hypothetical protein NPX13_g1343 [Xylaria arbuscula]|uniref:Uncharacterized protein n=1 Tax=Xylaria arbuscula TaxID=114810 RepID=A0A9W8NMW4_9PEZI|nr:hypothetical protein NPX13_g1343 [Xylaria arbuscula]